MQKVHITTNNIKVREIYNIKRIIVYKLIYQNVSIKVLNMYD